MESLHSSTLLKKIASRLPDQWQSELKRIQYRRQIAAGHFVSPEPEYQSVEGLVKAGDWVIDIGANVGHYTRRFSELVGPGGRVIAFEPVPVTFSLLAANAQLFAHANVTLINAAVSEESAVVGVRMPQFPTGLVNYYEARLSDAPDASLSVLTLNIDSLHLPHSIALVKIDAEGHELFVLGGLRALIERDRPVIVVETGNKNVVQMLSSFGYASARASGSPNLVCKWISAPAAMNTANLP
jgi:FkbM family methyltransferase